MIVVTMVIREAMVEMADERGPQPALAHEFQRNEAAAGHEIESDDEHPAGLEPTRSRRCGSVCPGARPDQPAWSWEKRGRRYGLKGRVEE